MVRARTVSRTQIGVRTALLVGATGLGMLAATWVVSGEKVVMSFVGPARETTSIVRSTNSNLLPLGASLEISRTHVKDSASIAVVPAIEFLITNVSARGRASDLEGKIEICVRSVKVDGEQDCSTQSSGFTRIGKGNVDTYRAIVSLDNPLALTATAGTAGYDIALKTNLSGTNIRSFRLSTAGGQVGLGLGTDAPRVNIKPGNITVRIVDELMGDINNNGKIEASDAQRVMASLSGGTTLTEQEQERADVNEDAKVDMVDALGILARATGMKFSDYASVQLSLGDANGDAVVTAADALMVAKHAEGGARLLVGPQLRSCDVDQDGRVTIADSKVLLAHSVGSIKSLPVKFGDVYPKGAPDGLYTLADVGLMQKYAVNNDLIPEGERLLADVNVDGVVNSTDTLAVMKAQQGQLKLPLLK